LLDQAIWLLLFTRVDDYGGCSSIWSTFYFEWHLSGGKTIFHFSYHIVSLSRSSCNWIGFSHNNHYHNIYITCCITKHLQLKQNIHLKQYCNNEDVRLCVHFNSCELKLKSVAALKRQLNITANYDHICRWCLLYTLINKNTENTSKYVWTPWSIVVRKIK
jgi:hypothetical protein